MTRLALSPLMSCALTHVDLTRPQQAAPAIRQECEDTVCAEASKHFKHCAEKVEGGKGWHGEDCVEELFHLMHCIDVSSVGS